MTLSSADSHSKSRAEEISAILRDEILCGQYRPGEHLPSERDLALRFATNRGAVRESLKKLEQLGIAAIKPGGVRVVPVEDASLSILGPLLDLEAVPNARLVDQVLEVLGALIAQSARAGLVLVMIILTLFLRLKVAMWVAAGIPIAVMGALWLFPAAGLNISSLTVLGFILVLGIVVDDAIVVGERIYSHESEDRTHREVPIEGTVEVAVPVIFGVLTTVAAFLPILLIEGRMGPFFFRDRLGCDHLPGV